MTCLLTTQNGGALVKKVKGTYLFKIKGADGSTQEWLVDLKNGTGAVNKGPGMWSHECAWGDY